MGKMQPTRCTEEDDDGDAADDADTDEEEDDDVVDGEDDVLDIFGHVALTMAAICHVTIIPCMPW